MKFLIVVDMQNDFITGSLGTKEAEAILPKVLEKIRTYRPEQIFVTQDTHPDNYLETNEGRHLPVAHCIAGSQGHALNRWWRRRWKAYLQTTLSASPPWLHPAGGKAQDRRRDRNPGDRAGGSVHRHLCAVQCHPVQSDLPGKRCFRGRCLLRLRHAPVSRYSTFCHEAVPD